MTRVQFPAAEMYAHCVCTREVCSPHPVYSDRHGVGIVCTTNECMTTPPPQAPGRAYVSYDGTRRQKRRRSRRGTQLCRQNCSMAAEAGRMPSAACPCRGARRFATRVPHTESRTLQIRGSIVVSISACHADDPGSIPGRGDVCTLCARERGVFCTPSGFR